MVWKRLTHPWADDGKEHTVVCWTCRGTGEVRFIQSVSETVPKG